MGSPKRPRAAGDGVRVLSFAPSSRRAAQAVDALRHGWPIQVGSAPILLPIETAPGAARSPHALISFARAATLKLPNQREAADPHAPVVVHAAEALDLPSALAIADPTLDLATPLKGPFLSEHLDWPEEAATALELARIAGILPAFLVDPEGVGEPISISPSDVDALMDPETIVIATRARLPIAACDEAEIVMFRSPDDLREHAALIIGRQRSDEPPLVRLHSECLTGDILGSLRCDCGPQLDAALRAMAAEARAGRWGVLLYLRQEGRGIGLINKLKAYRLQDQGFDTLEANQRLGLPAEARDFPVAARMLHLLGIGPIRLMTNNPAKLAGLQAAGTTILERIPHQLPSNPYNERYLATKRDSAGHLLT